MTFDTGVLLTWFLCKFRSLFPSTHPNNKFLKINIASCSILDVLNFCLYWLCYVFYSCITIATTFELITMHIVFIGIRLLKLSIVFVLAGRPILRYPPSKHPLPRAQTRSHFLTFRQRCQGKWTPIEMWHCDDLPTLIELAYALVRCHNKVASEHGEWKPRGNIVPEVLIRCLEARIF